VTISFAPIQARAARRNGSLEALEKRISEPLPPAQLSPPDDDRYLSMMAKVVFQAGFVWRVIEKKWPEFETVFLGFDPEKLLLLSPEQIEAIGKDKRIVRNHQKINSVLANALYIYDQQQQHGSFSAMVANWPHDDLLSLCQHLKKYGSRLGGRSGPRMLRNMGVDAYILTTDVVMCLRDAGLDIAENPTSLRDQKKVQQLFNEWHKQSGLSFTHLSRICAYSIGRNYADHKTGEN